MKSNSEDNSNTLPEPKITEDRSYDKKSPKLVLEELRGKSFAQEIENDKEKSAVLLNRAKQAERSESRAEKKRTKGLKVEKSKQRGKV